MMVVSVSELHIEPGNHVAYLKLALAFARQSPQKPTNYCVGAVLVDPTSGDILSTGFTLELPGNTHAEQCAFVKFAMAHSVDQELGIGRALPVEGAVLYTTMEPCGKRNSGQTSCIERLLSIKVDSAHESRQGIRMVVYGVREPKDLVDNSKGLERLENAGIKCLHVSGLESEIIKVAKLGHAET